MSKSNKKKHKKSTNVANKVQVQQANVNEAELENKEASVENQNAELTTSEQEANAVEVVKTDENAKPSKVKDKEQTNLKNKKNANNKKKDAKDGKKSFSQKCKALVSELKKVTWPTFKEACKQTGIVLALVIVFSLVLLGVNLLLGWLFGLIV